MKNIIFKSSFIFLFVLIPLFVFGCGSAETGSGNNKGKGKMHTYTVGGTVSGLIGNVVLQDNGGDDLEINADGPFVFNSPIEDGLDYEVDVLTPPDGQSCAIENATGTISGTDVDDVTVTCSDLPPLTFTVGGTVSGLIGNVVLQNNGTNDLELTADGPFVFNSPVIDGNDYHVTVLTQPNGQSCATENATGTVSGADVDNVAVTCSDLPPDAYTIGGTVSGLIGNVVLQNNDGDDLEIDADGPFEFNSPIVNGTDYEVTVLTQPEGQSCAIENATGTVSGADVDDVIVTCSPTVTFLFTAEVIYVDDYSNVLGGGIYVGQEISGQYTYGLDAVDSNPISYVGDYWYYSKPFGIEVNAGDLYFKTNPDMVNFLFELVNDYPGYYIKDNYLLRSYTNITNLNGFVDHIAWQLDDPTGTALDSTELTAFPPVLENWTSTFGLTIEGCYTPEIDGFCYIDTFFVRAIVTSVTVK